MSFKMNKLQKQIFRDRYAAPTDKDWGDCARRVAKYVAQAEKNGDIEKYSELFSGIIANGDFIPGGRILHGAGRVRPNLLNCYVLDFKDTVQSIGSVISNMYKISCAGGGVGFNFSPIRPRGSDIANIKCSAPGSVSNMKMINEIGNHVKAGKNRRVALKADLSVSHPDLIEFLRVKLDLAELHNFNISVAINDEFIDAVNKNKPWRFHYNNKWYDLYRFEIKENDKSTIIDVPAVSEEDALYTVDAQYRNSTEENISLVKKVDLKARDIWTQILRNSMMCGDPGIFNIDFTNKYTNVSYFERLNATNPCLTGDTVVCTPQGDYTIKELSDIGDDVPVYCKNDKGRTTIRYMRHPRLTGKNVPVYRVTLDDGVSFRATGNHKVQLTDGDYRRVNQLVAGDSLCVMTRYHASLKDVFPQCNSNSQNYAWLSDGFSKCKSEHRLVYEFYHGKIHKGHVIHHRDYNALNNCADDVRKHAIKLTKNLGRRFSKREWMSYAKLNGIPVSFSKWRRCHLNGGIYGLSKWAAAILGYDNIDCDPRVMRSYIKLCHDGYDCKIIDDSLFVIKRCEDCDEQLCIPHVNREVGLCRECAVKRASDASLSPASYNKRMQTLQTRRKELQHKQLQILSDLRFKHNRMPLKKAWILHCKKENVSCEIGRTGSPFKSWEEIKNALQTFNHKVISVEFVGYEDVYNGTVDEFHNFYTGGWESKQANGKPKWLYINNLQCGEEPLPDYGNCCLGHINVNNLYDAKRHDVNWKKFARNVRLGVRFLDDVLTVNNYPIDECRTAGLRSRRVGLGITGLHYLLIKLGLRYGSDNCIEFLERFFATFRNEAYKASIELAKERGAFEAFQPEAYLKEEFCKQLPPRIRSDIRKYGIRNAVLLTVAPTGTVSIVLDVSSGIEPIFAPAYYRRYRVNNGFAKDIVVDAMFKQFVEDGKNVDHFVGAYEVTFEEHLRVQATIQHYIDSAISKTINLPNDFVYDDKIADTVLKYVAYLKGVTFYRQDSKGDEPLKPIDIGQCDIETLVNDGIIKAAVDSKCATGSCDA
jgi:ribonucleotide reductase alpha subunit